MLNRVDLLPKVLVMYTYKRCLSGWPQMLQYLPFEISEVCAMSWFNFKLQTPQNRVYHVSVCQYK